MTINTGILLAAALAAGGSVRAQPPTAALPVSVQYNRDVRPIIQNACFKCHGRDLKANKADLRLDLSDNARTPHKDRSGRTSTPIVPGKPDESEVWRRVSSKDPTQMMPPPDALHLLTDRDRAVIRRWIEQGAVYEPHWAYLPPRKAELPGSGTPARNPIDRFVVKELEERGLTPSSEADRRTLIRRVSLDLVGLPPTVEETERFLGDQQPGAYERLVDRLLSSPHYGERMAVAWLDLARFADTVGFHGDQLYNNFPYRDYVIGAFNDNEPYDQFTREQLAGDLLPGATDRQRVATGFNRLNMVTREGGAQPKEYISKYAADRVRTVSTTWLGSTMGCCECHDHKYDPFKTRDFYAMEAYFADIKQYGVYENYEYTPEPDLKGTTNDSPFPPEIVVDSPYLVKRLARMRARCEERLTAVVKAIVADPAEAAAARDWAGRVAPRLKLDPQGWAILPMADAKPLKDDAVKLLPDQTARLGPVKKVPDTYQVGDGAVITLVPGAGPVATVRLEVLPDETYGGRVTSNGDDSFALTLDLAVLRAGKDKPEPISLADGYPNQPTWTYFNGRMVTSITSNWTSPPSLVREPQSLVLVLTQPIDIKEGDRLVATLTSENVSRVRISASPFGERVPGARPAPEIAAAFAAPSPTPEQMEVISAEYFEGTQAAHNGEFASMLIDVRDVAACNGGRAFSTVTVATKPAVIRVLARGNWQDESGAVVEPSPPGFLLGKRGPAAPGAPRQTRLDLANWIVSRDNPLTARAFVNRLWRQYFGTGLSSVIDDLGTQGEYPSDPELLDWLAVDFMDRGWDIKAMVRLIVTSDTYRQSSRYRPELADIDPNNRLLARQSPRRLDAEFIRDNALSAAGLINLDMGGPSVYPYQPAGYYAALQYPDREYLPSEDERQYRRGVYIHWQRTFLHPMLANFDAPSREECTASRIVSSTPQQALTLLNDPTFVEAARGLAEHAMGARGDAGFAASLDDAFLHLLARPPSERERDSLMKFFEGQLEYYRGKPDEAVKVIAIGNHPAPAFHDPPTLAAWISVARVLLNLNETIVRY